MARARDDKYLFINKDDLKAAGLITFSAPALGLVFGSLPSAAEYVAIPLWALAKGAGFAFGVNMQRAFTTSDEKRRLSLQDKAKNTAFLATALEATGAGLSYYMAPEDFWQTLAVRARDALASVVGGQVVGGMTENGREAQRDIAQMFGGDDEEPTEEQKAFRDLAAGLGQRRVEKIINRMREEVQREQQEQKRDDGDGLRQRRSHSRVNSEPGARNLA